MLTISGSELRSWVETMSDKWRSFFLRTPKAFSLPCDIRETKSVAELLQHIVAVELRYAQRLCGLPESAYEQIPFDSVEPLYQTHSNAMQMLRSVEGNAEIFWDESLEFSTRHGGVVRSPRRTIYIHLLMHSIRHYAQLATLMRQNGFPIDWQMDYIAMKPGESQQVR